MPALAMGLGYLGYSLGLWGYCLLRGYDVTLGSLMSPAHPPTWQSISSSQIPAGQVFPGAVPSSAGTTGPKVSPKVGKGIGGGSGGLGNVGKGLSG